MAAPVSQLAASEARNTAAPAMSDGRPTRAMINRRAVLGLVLLILAGHADRVPGQTPARPIPTEKAPAPTRTTRLA